MNLAIAGQQTVREPVAEAKRVSVLDVLRGFALLGIILANVGGYLGSASGTADRVVEWLVDALVTFKFYALFSLLFGAGFALLLQRAEARGVSITSFYSRRLSALLLIGLVLFLLVETNNILIQYAVLGFPLLLFRKASPRLILVGVVVSFSISSYNPARALTDYRMKTAVAGLDTAAAAAARQRLWRAWAEAAEQNRVLREAEAGHSYATLIRARAGNLAWQYSRPAGYQLWPQSFMMFLLGLYAVRRRIFHDMEANRPFLKRLFIAGLAVAAIGGAASVLDGSRAPAGPLGAILQVLRDAAPAALALFYASALMLLFRHARWRSRLLTLAPVGRMGLTNFLLQYVLMGGLFYWYGLGWYGQVGPAMGRVIAIGIFMLQIPLSQWWLSRFRIGPAEWLWRSFTYWRLQPLLRGRAPVTAT
jgi:uncharacterized protein